LPVQNTLDLKVGFSCNNNCRFCVVADKRSHVDKETAQIKEELKDGYLQGYRRLCFTGGEVTIRKDIFEIIKYAANTGFSEILFQTNGRKFSSLAFAKKVVESGVNSFAVSLHGHTPRLHDFFTQRPGSFRQAVQGIKNLRKLTTRIITNTVINKFNYSFLPKIADFLIGLRVAQYQLAFIHANGAAWVNFTQLVPPISLTAPFLHQALDKGIKAGLSVMTEAYPYCLMPGYELCVGEQYIPSSTLVKEYGRSYEFDGIRKNVAKVKFPQCRVCDYDTICEGVWREYPERFGNDEFKSVISRFRRSVGSFALQCR
jgi:MoaA/NifB/PqqE/SkfB family radical SAM enzyme